MKVVINRCFGGFGLSDKALLMLKEKGWAVEKTSVLLNNEYWTTDPRQNNDLFRSHTDLVEVVEALGDSANGAYSKLKVVEIPDGIEYEIDECDGIEEIHEVHRKWS